MKPIFNVRIVAQIAEWRGEWDGVQAIDDRKRFEPQSAVLYSGDNWEEALRVLQDARTGAFHEL